MKVGFIVAVVTAFAANAAHAEPLDLVCEGSERTNGATGYNKRTLEAVSFSLTIDLDGRRYRIDGSGPHAKVWNERAGSWRQIDSENADRIALDRWEEGAWPDRKTIVENYTPSDRKYYFNYTVPGLQVQEVNARCRPK